MASTGDNSAPLFVYPTYPSMADGFGSNDFMLDGVSIMLPENNDFAISPTPDGTAEFKVMTNSFGPQFGRSGGGVINVVTKSGANALHGRSMSFSATTGCGPTISSPMPKVRRAGSHTSTCLERRSADPYSRQDVLFCRVPGAPRKFPDWGADANGTHGCTTCWQLRRTRQPARTAVTIYDPATTRPNPSGSGFIRDPFPGNIIPADRINPVALKMMQYVPLPNREGTGPARVNNFAFQPVSSINSDQWSVRIDHRLSDRHSFFARATRNTGDSGAGGPFNTIADNVWGSSSIACSILS